MPEYTPDAVGEAQDQPENGRFEVKKVYVKDTSFESPNAPRVFTMEWEPDLELGIGSAATRFSPGDFEVTLTGTVKVTTGDTVMYLTEVTVAGIFEITGLTDDELGAVLGSYCPGILFPYLREAVSDLVVRGGFPQLVLAPVNFDQLYQRHLESAAGEAPAEEG